MSVASVGFSVASPPYHEAQRPQAHPAAQAAREQQERALSSEPKAKPREVIHSTASDLQRLVFNRKLQFVVDHNSREVIVKVIDKETDKVIKELPPEELQRLHRNLKETIGFLFDESV